jgi:alanine racemase
MNLARVVVNLGVLQQNFEKIKKYISAKTKVLIVLKANAYGLGAIKVAETALKAGANYLGVARTEEAIELRESGIEAPILVFSNFLIDHLEYVQEHNLIPTIADEHTLKQLTERLTAPLRVHIKLDSGMNRQGFDKNSFEKAIKKISGNEFIKIDGIFTHFASADDENKEFTKKQIRVFNEIYKKYKKQFPKTLFHAANSAAIINYPESHYDMVRAGILFYGSYPGIDTFKNWTNKLAVTLEATIIQIKNLKKGEGIGYTQSFLAQENMRVAVIGIGYGDGVSRALSNRGEVFIKGRKCKILGNVSMDLISVEIGNLEIEAGDIAVVFGNIKGFENSLVQMAKILQTLPYEILTQMSPRVKRIYVR